MSGAHIHAPCYCNITFCGFILNNLMAVSRDFLDRSCQNCVSLATKLVGHHAKLRVTEIQRHSMINHPCKSRGVNGYRSCRLSSPNSVLHVKSYFTIVGVYEYSLKIIYSTGNQALSCECSTEQKYATR